ncbi:hypothetical protein LCGC14_1112540 [marine sediment metagenome]|uniref:PD-(D/E)XK endonuclease-like domain-containing protein n=1 Tax=marine sediment metagenome TaxID=412755 RepID=A0A0F9MU83_9ZZZZ
MTATYQKRTHVSITTLCKFASCPRKFFYYAHGLQSEVTKGPFLFGEAMHMAFPIILSGGSLANANDAFDLLWDTSLDDKKRNPETAHLILANFMLSHGTNPHTGVAKGMYKLVSPPKNTLEISDRVSDYEVPFAIEIGLPVPLVGRIDAMCRHRDSGELWGLEFKTTGGDPYGNLSEGFLRAFDKNPQVVGYTMALRQLSNENVRGTILDATLVSHRKQDNMQYPIYVSDDEIAQFITWAQYYGGVLLAMEEKFLETNDAKSFPQFFTGCHPYASFGTGGFTCDYKILCDVKDWKTLETAFDVSSKTPFTITPTIEGQSRDNAVPNV